ANLPGVTLTLNQHPTLKAGANNAGQPLMYTPSTFAGGSSVSHWDVSLTPNALMEPAINNSLHDAVDLTRGHFQDIGWFGHPTATTLSQFTAEGRGDGIMLRWQFGDLTDVGVITLQRAPGVDGPWSPTRTELRSVGDVTTALDSSVEPGQTYFYRLNVMYRSGEFDNFGLTSASRLGQFAGGLHLGAPVPNPANRGTSFSFRIGRPEFVRIQVLDASGRVVRSLQNAMMPAGEHSRFWDSKDEGGGAVSPGVYFLNLRTSEGLRTQRVAVMN
ncbi:MAG: FlgD immunoglobulin-like domain containing protein, partial [Candidatus Eisenbacteria bacterium]